MRYHPMETHRIIHDSPPSSQRSDLHRTPTGDPPYKRCAVVRTHGLHLHYSKETVTYSPDLYLEC